MFALQLAAPSRPFFALLVCPQQTRAGTHSKMDEQEAPISDEGLLGRVYKAAKLLEASENRYNTHIAAGLQGLEEMRESIRKVERELERLKQQLETDEREHEVSKSRLRAERMKFDKEVDQWLSDRGRGPISELPVSDEEPGNDDVELSNGESDEEDVDDSEGGEVDQMVPEPETEGEADFCHGLGRESDGEEPISQHRVSSDRFPLTAVAN